eukprot:4318629-Prymnesium_polylepis.1
MGASSDHSSAGVNVGSVYLLTIRGPPAPPYAPPPPIIPPALPPALPPVKPPCTPPVLPPAFPPFEPPPQMPPSPVLPPPTSPPPLPPAPEGGYSPPPPLKPPLSPPPLPSLPPSTPPALPPCDTCHHFFAVQAAASGDAWGTCAARPVPMPMPNPSMNLPWVALLNHSCVEGATALIAETGISTTCEVCLQACSRAGADWGFHCHAFTSDLGTGHC